MSLNRKYTFSTTLSNNRNSTNPSFYINPSINNIESFVISSFQGVNNVYTFDSRNCNILIQETSQAPFTVSIPFGNYTITNLLSTLSTILTTASSTSVYTATKNDLTNIITITSDTTTFVIQDTINNAYYELGFLVNTTTPALTQTGSNQYDLSGVKIIHLVSNDLGNDGSFLVNSNYNILCSIPVDAPYLSPIHYQENSDLLINCKINELSSITFHLIDERHRMLSNLSDWSVQIITSFQ